MTNLLVVDDSAVDRRLAGEYLREDPALKVEYATDGREALARLEQGPVDLILTDLLMPEINGLELLRAVRRTCPQVPVILMTSQGNEELAVTALHEGAASYVPKRVLHHKLLDTIRRVLAVSVQQRCHWRLMGCMTASRFTFSLENDSALFAPLIAHLQEAMARMGRYRDGEWMRVGVALEEALTNALHHGNLEIGSELRDDHQAYYALVEQRRRQSPYRERRMHVDASLSSEKAVFVVGDEGAGFDPNTLPDPRDPANLEKASGRGVLLMRMFMDEVRYNGRGNTVTLVKYADGAPTTAQPSMESYRNILPLKPKAIQLARIIHDDVGW